MELPIEYVKLWDLCDCGARKHDRHSDTCTAIKAKKDYRMAHLCEHGAFNGFMERDDDLIFMCSCYKAAPTPKLNEPSKCPNEGAPGHESCWLCNPDQQVEYEDPEFGSPMVKS